MIPYQKPVYRPSPKELDGKMTQARQALSQNKLFFAHKVKNAKELEVLDIELDCAKVLLGLLKEIDPVKSYAGGRPPLKSYEEAIEGKELFAFSWNSSFFGKKMYLKFAIAEGCFFLVSIHEDRML